MKKPPTFQSLFALDCLIILIAGVQAGLGPFFAIYLKSDLRWDPYQIGIALGIVNFAAMLNQIPSGLLIDAYKIKRYLLAGSCLTIALFGFLITKVSNFSFIVVAQFFIGLAIAIIPPAIAAITLGLVGKNEFPKRESVNESLSHVGNIILVLVAGLTAYFNGDKWIVYSYALFSFLGIFPLLIIKGKEIDHNIARQLAPLTSVNKNIIPIKKILTSYPCLIFLLSAFIFHFSSAAQLALMGQIFVLNEPKTDAIFMAASIIISHLVMFFVSFNLIFRIQKLNRKPLMLLAFILVFIRSILYTVSHNPYFMISLQALDGISAGIFGVLAVVIVSELATNSGRFNFILGLMVLCQGIAYASSNVISGFISKLYSYNVGFYTLSAFALLGFIIFLLFMPETLKKKFF